MCKRVIFLVVFFFAFSAVGKGFGFYPEAEQVLKKYTGYECKTLKDCEVIITEANPADKDFTVMVPNTNGIPSITFSKVIRDKFGGQVFIGFWGDLFEKPSLRKEEPTKYYVRIKTDSSTYNFFNDNGNEAKKLIMHATIFNATMEKAFTAEYTGNNKIEAMHDIYHKLASQVADWLEKEIELQKKVQQKNTGNPGN